MAQSARRPRRIPPPRSLKDILREGPVPSLEALVLAGLGLSAGLALGFSSEARGWMLGRLGYGWAPAGIWLVASLTVLRYQRRTLRVYWRWWVVAAVVATVSIGVLSQFHPRFGLLAAPGLSGRWGEVVGGAPVGLAAGKLAAISLLTPVLLFPRAVGAVYWRALRYIGLAVQFAPVYVYLGLYHSYYFVTRRLRTLVNSSLRHQSLRRARMSLMRRMPAPVRTRFADGSGRATPSSAASEAPEGIDQGINLWADTETGVIPSWPSADTVNPREPEVAAAASASSKSKSSKWRLPSMEMLSAPEPRTDSNAPLEKMARHVESTLSDHGVNVEVKDIKAGPRIVRFGLVPGWVTRRNETSNESSSGSSKQEAKDSNGERSRVKVQSILMREKDLALALQTPYLRIEAPVPGEALVGLEVPSPSPTKVHLRDVMETPSFRALVAKGGLPVALGQDTGGAPVIMDLTSLPHMLIAGATGSGKSVCINSIIATLLLTKPPDQLRMLMVDPKRVELTPFNGIPHLIMPVIVDVDEVNVALRGLMREMLRRYKQLEDVGARNINGYNNRAGEPMPFLVLVVDELADLMMAGGFEVEQNLVRLAQLGRATGIHLVLATQRPSVNVVTGLLKANVPARAAFAVASQIDSRVILDTIGAEKLLGKGDMLLLNSESPKPRRVQGTLVYDEEIDSLVDHWTNQTGPPLSVIPMGEAPEGEGEEDDVDDGLMDQAREMALRNPNLSQSFMERRLKIGGSRATQIMGLLEDEGLLTPQ